MTIKEMRQLANEKINEGKTKQETYEELIELNKLPIEDIAKIVKSIPTLHQREKYKTLNRVFMFLMALRIIVMIYLLLITSENEIKWFDAIFGSIIIAINVKLLFGVVTYKSESYRNAAIFAIVGFTSASDLRGTQFEQLAIVFLGMGLVVLGLGFYLNSKLCASYSESKEKYKIANGEQKLKYVIHFKD